MSIAYFLLSIAYCLLSIVYCLLSIAARFCDCVEQMTGRRPGLFWYLCWKFFAPAVMAAVFIFYCISYEPVTYGKDYVYPKWAEGMGLCMSLASMLWVPGYMVYYLCLLYTSDAADE